MPLLAIVPAFALTALVLAMVPGQGVAMVLRQAMVGGPRCAYVSVAGNSSGLLVWGVASAIGLSEIFARSPAAYDALKCAGVTYLGLLSVRTLLELRHESGRFDQSGEARVASLAAYRLGLFTNLTNVKAAVFAVAFIPQFVPRSVPLATGIVMLAVVQAVVSTAWYCSLVAGISRASAVLARPRVRRWLTGVSALGLLALAGALLFTSPR